MGNLFVAVVNPGLSNKMASYTTDGKMFVIKTFYSSGGSSVAAERQYHAYILLYRDIHNVHVSGCNIIKILVTIDGVWISNWIY
jgi:hypothetical protein